MAFLSKVISVEKSIDTVTPVTQDVTGLDFTPKAYIVYTTSTDGVTDHIRSSIGFCDGTNQRSVGWGVTDNAGSGGTPTTTQTARIDRNDYVLYQITGTGGEASVSIQHDQFITHTSGTNGGVRIRYINNNTSAFRLHFIFLGGTDITNVKVGTFNTPTTTGQFNVTGLGFDGVNAVFLLNTDATSTVNTGAVNAKVNFGFASSPSKRFATSTVTRSAQATAQTFKIQKITSAIYTSISVTSGTISGQADYTGAITDGFGLDFTDVAGTSFPVFYLAIKGGRWDVQSVNSRTTAGTQTLTTEFLPKLAIANTIASADENMQNANMMFALGAASATTEQNTIWNADNNNVAPSQSARSSSITDMLQSRTADATGANSAITHAIDLSSFGATSCVLNYATTSATAVKINVILAGDSPVGGFTTVTKDVSFPYDVRTITEKNIAFPYHIGGGVSAGPFEHQYNIQGLVVKDVSFSYNIQNLIEKDISFPYSIHANTFDVTKDISFPYNIVGLVQKDIEFSYHLDESPSLNLSGYLKPYKCRIFIMSFDGTETYHTFNQFDFESSNIIINGLRFDLARDSAGDFEITVEDSNLMIDTSLVGEGCSVLIQIAKRESELGDGGHDVIWGYMKTKEVSRPETNNLVYIFRGYGAAVRTMERIVDFRDEARRMSHSTTDPDPDDIKMEAWRLFHRLFADRAVFPAGMQRERQFDTTEIETHEPKVDVFIPLIDQYLVEMSQAANFIADNSNAVWGVSPRKQPYIKYRATEKTSIILKGKMEADDDRFKTAYFLGGFRFHDSIEQSDGFFNCLYAVVGTKEISSNVVNITAIRDRWTGFALDEPPSDAVDPDITSDIGPFIPMYNADPTAAVWDEIVNLAKQWPLNVFRVVVKPYSGNAGFDSLPDTAKTNWNTTIDKMQDAVFRGIFVFGWIDVQDGNKSLSAVEAEIDEYATQSQIDGIFLDNMSTDTADISYYDQIADHAKSYHANMGQSTNVLSIYGNAEGVVPQSFYTQTSMDRFVVYEDAGLPDVNSMLQPWYNEIGPSRRIVWCHTIPTSSVSDASVKEFIRQGSELTDLANLFYITDEDDSPGQYSRISTRFTAMMEQLDISAAKALQNSGQVPAGRAVQQDLCMSFIAQSPRTSDLIIILSKVGNPISEPGENLNVVNGLIMGNRVVNVTEVDEESGQTVTRQVDMPDFTKTSQIASFNIPFNEIREDTPSIHFLHKTVTKANVQVGQRYWVFMRGRGQNASNTFRWHHADSVGFEYKSGRRLPSAGAYSSAHWDIFSNETHPGFALTYMQNTTQLSIAMNGDSAKIHGQTDELVDLSGITDDELVIKIQQSMIADASSPKRVYEFDKVTVPDDLILPGQLITIIDELSEGGQAAGGTAGGIQAEVVEVSYNFSPEQDGCAYVSLRAIASVNREYAYYNAKLNRGDIDIDFPFIPPPPPRPLPDNQAPVIIASPKGGTYNSPISVKFIVSEKDVTVFYTTDGTTPLVLFGGVEEETQGQTQVHTTQIYKPGETPDIVINKSTDLQFIASDVANNKSTVYLEKYNITSPQNIGKALSMAFFQDVGLSASAIASSYASHLRLDTDRVTLHKRVEESINSTWENAVLGVPSKYQEVEFQSYDQMVAYLPTAKSKGWDIIGYNIERDDSPDFDTRDVVKSVKRFADKVHREGLLVRLNPRHDYTKTYAARIAKYADIYNIQAQFRQADAGDVDDFKKFVKDSAQTLRSNNSKVFITLTLSADLKQHESLRNQSRLDTLKNRWTWAKKYCDGVRIFYKTTDEFNIIVVPFIQWYNVSGRT